MIPNKNYEGKWSLMNEAGLDKVGEDNEGELVAIHSVPLTNEELKELKQESLHKSKGRKEGCG